MLTRIEVYTEAKADRAYNMIELRNVNKSFGMEQVLRNRCDVFGDSGFVLLLGESGSGKTTFLNILYGLIPFDNGTVSVDGIEYSGQVDRVSFSKKAEYITQDPFFVDFLTMRDNLIMVCENQEAVQAMTDRFGLTELLQQYPETLSGGERQRFAVIRSLLKGKKILLLDEPTASLDAENKRIVFEFLTSIRDHVLILCATHDRIAEEYADQVIGFDKDTVQTIRKRTANDSGSNEKQQRKRTVEKQTVNLNEASDPVLKDPAPYLRCWFTHPHRRRGSKTTLFVFLLLAFLFCIFADIPERKLDQSREHIYHLNVLDAKTLNYTHWKDICPSDQGIAAAVLNYQRSCPDGNENTDFEHGAMGIMPDYELTDVLTAPSDPALFRLSQRILYGSYFTEPEQMILTYEMALRLNPSQPEKLIGKTLTKTFYGLGTLDLTIVGILDKLTEEEMALMDQYTTNRQSYSNYFFIPSSLTERLENDETFFYVTHTNGQRSYDLYFDTYFALKNYYNTYNPRADSNENYYFQMNSIGSDYQEIFSIAFPVLFPLSILLALLAITFYLQMRKTEYAHRHAFISVFEYDGYDKQKVLKVFLRMNVAELAKITVISGIAAVLLTLVFNGLNYRFHWIPFQVFTYNFWMLGGFFAGMLLIGTLFTRAFYDKVRVLSWYEDLIDTRDLI